jgi:O-antigen ligase
MVWSFLAIGGVYMFGRAFPQLNQYTSFILAPATGSVFWIWLTVLAAGQAFFNQKIGYRIRALLFILVGLIIYVAFIIPENRDWASGWLPAGVALMVVVWLRWPRVSVGLGAALGLVLMLNFRAVLDLLLAGDNAYSLLTRTAAFQILWQIIQVNPLLGVGPANYYYYTSLYSLLGYYVKFNSHNQYVDIMAQVGLLGLFFFLWFAWEIGRMGVQLKKHLAPDGFAIGYLAAALAGLVGMLMAGTLGDWVIPFVYNVGVSGFRASLIGWLFLGGIITLYNIYQRKLTTSE